MKTLTYQDMMFVSGGKNDVSEPPPKAEVSAGPTEEELFIASMRCAVALSRAKKSPTVTNGLTAAYECTEALKMTGEYLGKRFGRKN